MRKKVGMASEAFQEHSNSRQGDYRNKYFLKKSFPGYSKSTKNRLTPDERKRIDNDMISLKHTLNLYREENNKLREQMNSVKRELKSKNSYAKELNNQVNLLWINERASLMSPIDPKTRQQIKALEKEIKQVQRERNILAQYAKESKLEGVQAEVKIALEECRRLRSMIETVASGTLKDKEVDDPREVDNPQQLALENKQLIKKLEVKRQELERMKEMVQLKRKFKMQFKPHVLSHASDMKKSKKVATSLRTEEDIYTEKEFKKIAQVLNERTFTCLI